MNNIDTVDQQVRVKLEPFMLSKNGEDASEFGIIFIHNGKYIQYSFECTDNEVLNEWYFIDDKKVFERVGSEVTFGSKYQKMLSFYKKVPTERLYIAVLEYFLEDKVKEAILDDFISFFINEYNVFSEILFESTIKKLAGSVMISNKLVDDRKYREEVEQYLRLIDVGIKRLDVQTEIVINESTGKGKKEKAIRTVHDIYDERRNQ